MHVVLISLIISTYIHIFYASVVLVALGLPYNASVLFSLCCLLFMVLFGIVDERYLCTVVIINSRMFAYTGHCF